MQRRTACTTSPSLIGFIDRQRIVGKALAVAFSLDRNHHWVPRFNRFFTKLN